MLQKTKGIVLHTLKYNDTSIIVDMYTELSGRASFLVTVPRSRKAAVKSVLFQPLSFIELEATLAFAGGKVVAIAAAAAGKRIKCYHAVTSGGWVE